MNLQARTERLRRVARFRSLHTARRWVMASASPVARCRPGACLFVTGDGNDAALVVLDGRHNGRDPASLSRARPAPTPKQPLRRKACGCPLHGAEIRR